MDEVGRGTSTLDGLSLANAIFKYLYEHIKCRGIFATHYHEMASMLQKDMMEDTNKVKKIGFYQTKVAADSNGNTTCLYKIEKGIMDSSHGIEVAKMAGLPEQVIHDAVQIYATLSADKSKA
jgi:DNA mismatch repair protein MutS